MSNTIPAPGEPFSYEDVEPVVEKTNSNFSEKDGREKKNSVEKKKYRECVSFFSDTKSNFKCLTMAYNEVYHTNLSISEVLCEYISRGLESDPEVLKKKEKIIKAIKG